MSASEKEVKPKEPKAASKPKKVEDAPVAKVEETEKTKETKKVEKTEKVVKTDSSNSKSGLMVASIVVGVFGLLCAIGAMVSMGNEKMIAAGVGLGCGLLSCGLGFPAFLADLKSKNKSFQNYIGVGLGAIATIVGLIGIILGIVASQPNCDRINNIAEAELKGCHDRVWELQGGSSSSSSSSSDKKEEYSSLKKPDVNGMTVKEACDKVREAGWSVKEVAGDRDYSEKSNCSDNDHAVSKVYYNDEKYWSWGEKKDDYETVTIYFNNSPKEESSSSSSSSSSTSSSSTTTSSSSSSNSEKCTHGETKSLAKGNYEVGVDIKPGTWKIKGPSMLWISVYTYNSKADLDDDDYDDWTVITASDGEESIKFDAGQWFSIDESTTATCE